MIVQDFIVVYNNCHAFARFFRELITESNGNGLFQFLSTMFDRSFSTKLT